MQSGSWKEAERVEMFPGVTRRVFYGERSMLTMIDLKKGAEVPAHRHESEQITWVMSGSLEMTVGGKTRILSAGDVIVIPGSVEHSARALEDTVDIEVFSPVRQEWIKK
ncbi:cupin [Thermogymnomonas acidicola]|uniref:Cupin n=2 Tax=Thermogymnomonas acidicola TaxID=399579 RepID=A0AA37BQJ1_9ARCH|nr:cupin domain-containing protein [Thermogymnomonas acidicola]GGM69426.1 cupin [Thermogymnomonas acidicola]